MAKKFDRELLVDCATELLNYLGLQDPAYAERIQITKDEFHLDELQTALMYMAWILDNGYHTVYREYPFMLPGYVGHLGPRPCSNCGTEFVPAVPSAAYCDRQACLDKQAEALDRAFESKHGN